MITYLDDAIEALMTGLLQLTNDDNQALIKSIQKYQYPQPTTYPFGILFMGGGNFQPSPTGAGLTNQTFTVALRYIIGQVNDGYVGELQKRFWKDQIRIINHLYTYNMLNFPNVTPPEGLRGTGLRVDSVSRLGIFRDDTTHIGVEFSMTLPFIIQIERNI